MLFHIFNIYSAEFLNESNARTGFPWIIIDSYWKFSYTKVIIIIH